MESHSEKLNGETQKEIEGQESWVCETPALSAAVTVHGAMMAPVHYTLADGRAVQPYYLNPWRHESLETITPPILKTLRGDFFCLPFGGENAVGEEHHQPHGESSSAPWRRVLAAPASTTPASTTPESATEESLALELDYTACPGRVRRELGFGRHKPYVVSYQTLTGFNGDYSAGLHATLHGGTDNGIWTLQTAPFDLGITDPFFESPTSGEGEYSALAPGARFSDLREVPTRWKTPGTTDCSRFPARKGFVDILALYRHRSRSMPVQERLVWTVAINQEERYLWYSIKDASVLPATVIWMEHGGRHQPPWSGRNSCIGIEETCSYLAAGRSASIRPNPVTEAGIPTALSLRPDTPTTIATVQGVIGLDDTHPKPGELVITGLRRDSDGSWSFTTAQGPSLSISAPLSVFGD